MLLCGGDGVDARSPLSLVDQRDVEQVVPAVVGVGQLGGNFLALEVGAHVVDGELSLLGAAVGVELKDDVTTLGEVAVLVQSQAGGRGEQCGELLLVLLVDTLQHEGVSVVDQTLVVLGLQLLHALGEVERHGNAILLRSGGHGQHDALLAQDALVEGDVGSVERELLEAEVVVVGSVLQLVAVEGDGLATLTLAPHVLFNLQLLPIRREVECADGFPVDVAAGHVVQLGVHVGGHVGAILHHQAILRVGDELVGHGHEELSLPVVDGSLLGAVGLVPVLHIFISRIAFVVEDGIAIAVKLLLLACAFPAGCGHGQCGLSVNGIVNDAGGLVGAVGGITSGEGGVVLHGVV